MSNKSGIYFVLPAVIYMLFFIGFPIIFNIGLSFFNANLQNISQSTYIFVGWENYRKILANDIFWLALKNTMIYTISSLSIQFILGFLLALFFNLKFTWSKYLRGLIILSWMLPTVVIALIFRYLFLETGPINSILLSLGFIKEITSWFSDPKYALSVVIITNCWIGIPFNTLLLTTGLSNIPVSIIENAKLDGSTALIRFFYITLPMLKPAIQSVLILGFIYTFKVFDLVFAMTGGGPVNSTEVLSTLSYRLSFKHYYFSEGATVANILMVILYVMSIFYIRSTSKEGERL
ncbi:MAG: carbohydrate ABC transporter permease [Brevinema sp.]